MEAGRSMMNQRVVLTESDIPGAKIPHIAYIIIVRKIASLGPPNNPEGLCGIDLDPVFRSFWYRLI